MTVSPLSKGELQLLQPGTYKLDASHTWKLVYEGEDSYLVIAPKASASPKKEGKHTAASARRENEEDYKAAKDAEEHHTPADLEEMKDDEDVNESSDNELFVRDWTPETKARKMAEPWDGVIRTLEEEERLEEIKKLAEMERKGEDVRRENHSEGEKENVKVKVEAGQDDPFVAYKSPLHQPRETTPTASTNLESVSGNSRKQKPSTKPQSMPTSPKPAMPATRLRHVRERDEEEELGRPIPWKRSRGLETTLIKQYSVDITLYGEDKAEPPFKGFLNIEKEIELHYLIGLNQNNEQVFKEGLRWKLSSYGMSSTRHFYSNPLITPHKERLTWIKSNFRVTFKGNSQRANAWELIKSCIHEEYPDADLSAKTLRLDEDN